MLVNRFRPGLMRTGRRTGVPGKLRFVKKFTNREPGPYNAKYFVEGIIMNNIDVVDILNRIYTDLNNLMLTARAAAEGMEMEENHMGAAGMHVVECELGRILEYTTRKREVFGDAK